RVGVGARAPRAPDADREPLPLRPRRRPAVRTRRPAPGSADPAHTRGGRDLTHPARDEYLSPAAPAPARHRAPRAAPRRALRRAAALGDGWYGVGHIPESAAAQAGRLRALLAAAGREGAPFELTVSHAGSALAPDDVRRYAGAGIARVVVLPWQRGREAEEALARLAAALGLRAEASAA